MPCHQAKLGHDRSYRTSSYHSNPVYTHHSNPLHTLHSNPLCSPSIVTHFPSNTSTPPLSFWGAKKIGSLFHKTIVFIKPERFSRVKSQLGQFPKLLKSYCPTESYVDVVSDIGEVGAGVYSKLLSAASH